MSLSQLIQRLQTGHRLEKPVYAPDEIERIMSHCWKINPKDRPTFRQLEGMLGDYLEESLSGRFLVLNEPYIIMNEAQRDVVNMDPVSRLAMKHSKTRLNLAQIEADLDEVFLEEAQLVIDGQKSRKESPQKTDEMGQEALKSSEDVDDEMKGLSEGRTELRKGSIQSLPEIGNTKESENKSRSMQSLPEIRNAEEAIQEASTPHQDLENIEIPISGTENVKDISGNTNDSDNEILLDPLDEEVGGKEKESPPPPEDEQLGNPQKSSDTSQYLIAVL